MTMFGKTFSDTTVGFKIAAGFSPCLGEIWDRFLLYPTIVSSVFWTGVVLLTVIPRMCICYYKYDTCSAKRSDNCLGKNLANFSQFGRKSGRDFYDYLDLFLPQRLPLERFLKQHRILVNNCIFLIESTVVFVIVWTPEVFVRIVFDAFRVASFIFYADEPIGRARGMRMQ